MLFSDIFNQIIYIAYNIIFTLLFLFLIRIYIVYSRIHGSKPIKPRQKANPVKSMILLGSGGHTFEMLRLIQNMDNKFCPRIYVIADTDSLSEQKAMTFEKTLPKDPRVSTYTVEKIPRSREVGQSWISTVFTTLRACFTAVILILRHKPDLILCNGPGTCVPLCLVAFLCHVVGWKHINIVYIESICRVKTMSLSGKILYPIADRFLVQWPHLKEKYPRVKYMGKLL